MDPTELDPQGEPAVGGEVSAASLRRAIGTAAERIGALETERCALADARDDVDMYRRDVEGRLAEARRALARMEAAVDACLRRAAELETEAAAAVHDNLALDRRDRALAGRLQRLVDEADALADEQRQRRDAATAIGMALEEVCDTLSRIDEKIRFADRKHEATRETAAGGPVR